MGADRDAESSWTVDPVVAKLLADEQHRRRTTIQLIAAENVSSRVVRDAQASELSWKTAEGQPGARFHAGCETADAVEQLAVERARMLFGAARAWVQPLSGSLANLIAYAAVFERLGLQPGRMRVVAMATDHGGHLSHGARASFTHQLFDEVATYPIDRATGRIDFDEVADLVRRHRPHLLIAGASAYPRNLDFAAFGEISEHYGALLLADIAHLSGLVAGGVHPSPLPHADLVTCSTYKAGGPRGGLILAGERADQALCTAVTRAVFPGVQGTSDMGVIAAKAIFFAEMSDPAYAATQRHVVANARLLAALLTERGYDLVAGGTDTHMLLIDVMRSLQITGADAEQRLAAAGLYVNRNIIPGDRQSARVTSGIRLGTNTVTRVGMGAGEIAEIADCIDHALRDASAGEIGERVRLLAGRFGDEPVTAPLEPPRVVFTNGVFDLFHDGHARLLARAHALGDQLIVGVASDASCAALKRPPLQPWAVRAQRVAREPGVSVVLETPWSIDLTPEFYAEHGISIQVQGDGTPDDVFPVAAQLGLLRRVERTAGISTTKLVALLESKEAELLDGGALNDVTLVAFEGERFVIKHGARSVGRRYAIALPDTRIHEEHTAIRLFRERLAAAGEMAAHACLPRPLWCNDDDLLITHAAPAGAQPLAALLDAGVADAALLEELVELIAALHRSCWHDAELRAQTGAHRGFREIKIGLQCGGASNDPHLQERIDAFVERSLRDHADTLLHGDLAPKNVLVHHRELLLIDFEESGYGDSALDVGYLLAHLHLASIRDDKPRWSTADQLVEVYVNAMGELLASTEAAAWRQRCASYSGIFVLSRLHSRAPMVELSESERQAAEQLGRDLLALD